MVLIWKLITEFCGSEKEAEWAQRLPEWYKEEKYLLPCQELIHGLLVVQPVAWTSYQLLYSSYQSQQM
jgi:hypothetical protein